MRTWLRIFACISRRALIAGAVVLAVLAVADSALAGDEVYYAGGKEYQLVRSTTEFGVLLSDRGAAAQVRDRADATGAGLLQRIEGDRPDSRYRLLVVSDANAKARATAGSLPDVEWVRPVYRFAGSDSLMLSTGQLVARVVPGLSEADVEALWQDYGVEVVRPFDGLDNTYILRPVDDPQGDEVAVAAALQRDSLVVYAHPDFATASVSRQVTPEDEFFSEQWYLQNTGQDGATVGVDIGVTTAWETTLGADVRVGMLDDSCDVDHEDLRSNYLNVGQDIVDQDDDPRPTMVGERHGTAVMGVICAAANDSGVRGVAPSARFTATRGGLEGTLVTYAETASAYTFARQQEVDVHNNSWGYGFGVPTPSVVADAVQTACEQGRPYEDDEGETHYRGMVLVFASGNDGLEAPEDISSLPCVIAVGATNAADHRSSYSNYGQHLDVMAPSNAGDEVVYPGLPAIVTTDNTDDAGFAEAGYNDDGYDDFGDPNLSDPDYTKDFGGTSAAAPIVSGVAALILAANPELTSTQVRVVLEHTAEQVSPEDALYDAVTSRSNRYGYGRVNAAAAVQAAVQSKTNGGFTWPDRVSNVRVAGETLYWDNGSETRTIYVLQSNDVFQWRPEDGTEYTEGSPVTTGVTVVFKDSGDTEESYKFTPPDFGTAYFAIFAQNQVGRYSWGVAVDSEGNVTDAGPLDTGTGSGGDDGDEDTSPVNEVPNVSVEVSPRSGTSPLTVNFKGNALTNSDVVSTEWDFGDGSPVEQAREVTHVYTVTDGTTTRFIATFTVEDAEGDVGSRSVAIDVASESAGGGTDAGDSADATGSAEITIEDADGDETNKGFAPFDVTLSVETDDPSGNFYSVLWELGDGATADTVTVYHTYTTPGTYAVRATVTYCHATNGCLTTSNPGGSTWTYTSPVEFIYVEGSSLSGGDVPSVSDDGAEESQDNGATSTTLSTGRDASGGVCGLGVTPLLMFAALALAGRHRGRRVFGR